MSTTAMFSIFPIISLLFYIAPIVFIIWFLMKSLKIQQEKNVILRNIADKLDHQKNSNL